MTHLDVTQALYAVEALMAGRAAQQELPAPRTLENHEWPPDYGRVHAWRRQQLARFDADPDLLEAARGWYAGADLTARGTVDPAAMAERCVAFICHWCDTSDPRNALKGKPVTMPLVLFRRQDELVQFAFACMYGDAAGLVDKSRDMGATWVFIGVSVWAWLHQPGMAIGWGSNHLEQVDKLGEPDTIFEKMRGMIRALPDCFRPAVVDGIHLKHGICINPDNDAVVRGQGGKNIGRGGRSRLYFVDESAHLEHPGMVEASLSENTRCRIDLSSAGAPGTVFDSTLESGKEWRLGAPVVHGQANVFVLDWTAHPEKTAEWYGRRQAYYKSKGMPEVVAREIDRNPMGAQEGIIIAHEYVQAAVDAHRALGFDDSGGWWGGLDVADEGRDTNALVRGRGVVVKHAAEREMSRDPGETARWAFRECRSTSPIVLQYDCIGLGTNVKSEFNRLTQDEAVDARWLTLVPWLAGAAVLDPGKRVIPDDDKSQTNKNYFENFKAQAWWNVEQQFYRTWMCVRALDRDALEVEGEGGDLTYIVTDEDGNELRYGVGELISLDSQSIPPEVRHKLMRELSQATWGQSARLKLLVNKAPEGRKSPNLADGLVMGRFPAKLRAPGGGVSMFGPKVIRG